MPAYPSPEPAPATTALTARVLRRALIAGVQRVIAERELLNRINVFPVADGDTGNNLASTLGSVLNGALGRRGRHAGELLRQVGDDAIDGARGNSGAILAQFLQGAGEHARHLGELDGMALAEAVRHGAASARAALAQPVEGTILSVIDSFAEGLAEGARRSPAESLANFLAALERTRMALAHTPQQMPLLLRAGVVDAGARGFVDLLEGIAGFMASGPRQAARRPWATPVRGDRDIAMPGLVHDEAVDPARRWCTECLLLGEAIDRDLLRAELDALGADSIVLAGGRTRLRVHAHVGAPQRLFDACARHGGVDGMKADDMLLQARSARDPQHAVIVTDSAADLPEAIAERYAIHVVPVRVDLDGRDYLDKVGLGTGEFYRRMAASRQLPRTSQPPPGDFRRTFDVLLAHHPQIVYVGLSRAVSGTLQSGEHAAARSDVRRVHVFDSGHAAGGQALLAWRAAELARAGWGAADILAELAALRPRTHTWAMARDIRHAVRGGRIPAWAGSLVRFSGLTPIARITPGGRLGIAGALLARARAPEAFAAYVARRVSGRTRWRAIVGHCDARADGERLLSVLRGRLALDEAHLVETGPAIGAHAGRRTLVVSLQPAPDAPAGPPPPLRG